MSVLVQYCSQKLFLSKIFVTPFIKIKITCVPQVPQAVNFTKNSFLRQMLFYPSSASIRQVASLLVVSLAHNSARKPLIIDLLTRYLSESHVDVVRINLCR